MQAYQDGEHHAPSLTEATWPGLPVAQAKFGLYTYIHRLINMHERFYVAHLQIIMY